MIRVMLLVFTVVGSMRPAVVGRLRYCTRIPMENVVWSENNFPVNTPAYVYEVNGNARAALLVNKTATTIATRMVYDTSNGLETIQHLPSFRSLVHKYVKELDLTHLPHDERVQFLAL